jgi:hypothetical protein
MLQLNPQSIIYIASIPVDFRKGIDTLAFVCRELIQIDPLEGAMFLFYNKARNCIKILAHDGQGFWLCSKRLSSGKFQALPDKYSSIDGSNNSYRICYRVMQVLINNGDARFVRFAKNWRKITV